MKKQAKAISLKESLKKAIENSGLTQEQLELASGVPQTTLSRFIRGKGLTIDNASKICEALGLVLIQKDTPAKGGSDSSR